MTASSNRFLIVFLACLPIATISSCKARNASTLKSNSGDSGQELTNLLASLDANLAQLETKLAAKSSTGNSGSPANQFTSDNTSSDNTRSTEKIAYSKSIQDKEFSFECNTNDTECELAVIAVKVDLITQILQNSGQLLNDRTVADGLAQLLPQYNQLAAVTAYKGSATTGWNDQSAIALTEETPPDVSALIRGIKSVRASVQSLNSRAKAEDLRIRREEHGKYVNNLWQSYQEALAESNRQIKLGNSDNSQANALIAERNQLVNLYNAGADRAVDSSGSSFKIVPRMNALANQIDTYQMRAESHWVDAKYSKTRASELYKDWQEAQRNYPQN